MLKSKPTQLQEKIAILPDTPGVYIYYNGIKYVYELVNKYDEVKDGTIVVHRNNEDTVLTLITCKKNTKDTQTVFIGYLNNKTKYYGACSLGFPGIQKIIRYRNLYLHFA